MKADLLKIMLTVSYGQVSSISYFKTSLKNLLAGSLCLNTVSIIFSRSAFIMRSSRTFIMNFPKPFLFILNLIAVEYIIIMVHVIPKMTVGHRLSRLRLPSYQVPGSIFKQLSLLVIGVPAPLSLKVKIFHVGF